MLLLLVFHARGQENRLLEGNVQPRIFGQGVISTGDYESHPAFSPGGDTLYFLKSAPDFSSWTICVSYFRNNRWSPPEIASFSGRYNDADPFITKDGNILYFISNRPVQPGGAEKDFDIWKVEQTDTGWGQPVPLPEPVNSSENEYYPTLADNGNIYFGSRRKNGKGEADIYRCKLIDGMYGPAENLGDGINSPDFEYEPFVSQEEEYLIFMAATSENLENADLYISYYSDGKWTRKKKLPWPVSSGGIEFSPKVSRDGQFFFFSSTRNKHAGPFPIPENSKQLHNRIRSAGNGLGDIYRVRLKDPMKK